MNLTPREVSIHFGWLIEKMGKPQKASAELDRSTGELSKLASPNDDRLPSVILIAKASALTGDYRLLDAINAAAGREDETARLRQGLIGMKAQLEDLLEGLRDE